MQTYKSFQPDMRLITGIIFSLGAVTAIALVLAVLIAAAYLLNITVSALGELAGNIASVYGHADSFTQFLMIVLLGYVLYHIVRSVVRPYIKRGVK